MWGSLGIIYSIMRWVFRGRLCVFMVSTCRRPCMARWERYKASYPPPRLGTTKTERQSGSAESQDQEYLGIQHTYESHQVTKTPRRAAESDPHMDRRMILGSSDGRGWTWPQQAVAEDCDWNRQLRLNMLPKSQLNLVRAFTERHRTTRHKIMSTALQILHQLIPTFIQTCRTHPSPCPSPPHMTCTTL